MRQVPLECNINIAVKGPLWVEVANQEHLFTAMLISHSGSTCFITINISDSISNQLGLLVPSLISQAKIVSDQEFYKHQDDSILEIGNLCIYLPFFGHFMLHILVRVLAISMLFAYFQEYAILFILMSLLLNLCVIAFSSMGSEFRQSYSVLHIITRFILYLRLAIVLVIAPAAPGTLSTHKLIIRWSCLAMALTLTVTTLTLNLLSSYDVIPMNPAMMRFNTTDSFISSAMEPLHPNIMSKGALTFIGIAVLVNLMSGIFGTVWKCACAHKLQASLDSVVQHFTKQGQRCWVYIKHLCGNEIKEETDPEEGIELNEKEVSKSESELELVIDKIIDGVLKEVIVRTMTRGEEEETV